MSSLFCLLLLINVMCTDSEVVLHKTGKLNVVVSEKRLHLIVTNPKNCHGNIEVHYRVTKVADPEFAVAGDDKMCKFYTLSTSLRSRASQGDAGYDSVCPLAKTNDNQLDIDVIFLPTDCTVKLKNADLSSEASKRAADQTAKTVVIVGFVLGSLILIGMGIAAFVWFVGYPCWKRRQQRKRKPVESPVNEPPSLLKMPEKTKPQRRNSKKTKKGAESKLAKPTPAEATPTPSTNSAVPPLSNAKLDKPGIGPVQPAADTEEDMEFDEGKKKATEPQKAHWNDKKFFTGNRAQESYDAIRARGSSIAEKPAGSKKSQKTDSLEEHYMHVESAVESIARHGFLQQTMRDAAVLSRRESKNTPQAFLDMQKRYADATKRRVDVRELTLLTQLPQDSFSLLEELSTEARTQLMAKGVKFASDSRSATFTEEARAFVAAQTTPAFVMLVAFGAEFGYLVRLQAQLVDRERDFRCYSIQLLLLIAVNQAVSERIRREALAFMMVKIARQLPKYDTSQLDEMAFPMSLVSEVIKRNPEFYRHPEKFQTGWKDPEGCCQKNGTAEATSTPAPTPVTKKEKQPDKKESVTTATSKTSMTEGK